MPRQNIRSEAAPAAVTDVARQLGANIAAARKRRRWRTADLAARAGLTRETLRRVEAGELGTGLGAFLAALWALGLHEDARYLASAETDRLGRTLTEARLPSRVRLPLVNDDF